MRYNRDHVDMLRNAIAPVLSDKSVRVMGSAPNATFSADTFDVDICVNGSLYNLSRHTSRSPGLTYLNNALFRDDNAYTKATYDVLRNGNLGLIVHSNYDENFTKKRLAELNISYERLVFLTKYDRRIIFSQMFKPTIFGSYPFDSNISNGICMVVLALWAGAIRVHMAGFSFQIGHAYSEAVPLSIRAHIAEDQKMLALIHRIYPGRVDIGTLSSEHATD